MYLKTALTIAAVVIYTSSFSQKAVYTTNKGIIIGFGAGASYQQSDIANPMGSGFDFIFGSYLRKKENEFLAVDWKFRYLMGENQAHDHRINTDFTYSNIKYAFFSYDAELGLTLNRFAERTRIVISGFAGAGITHGRTFTDLLDEGGNVYDYSSIDPGKTRREIVADLLELTDGEYETKLVNRAAIFPTAGIFIGYRFSRSFTLGIEHKTHFSLTERNSAFGIDIDNRVYNSSRTDMNHYTSLGFRWALGGGGRARRPSITTPYYSTPATPRTEVRTERPVYEPTPVIRETPPPQKPVTQPARPAPPAVRFTNPAAPVNVQSNVFPIEARATNVNRWNDVTVRVNGEITYNFSLSNTGLITTNAGLREGLNVIEISVRNDGGVASARAEITYARPSRPQAPAPVQPPVQEQLPVQPPVQEQPPVQPPVTPPTPVQPPVQEQPPVQPPVQEQPPVQAPAPAQPQQEEKPCGVRINPGNAEWQFCLVTPAGTFNRDTLRRNTFTYSGPAQSLFFMPIAGGGDARVNGKPYPLKPGQYYLFSGNLKVALSTRNPGSMGQWSVCIETDREPVSGSGNNRPASPCETSGAEARPAGSKGKQTGNE